MASSYPGALDSFTNPSSTDAMDASAALYHDTQHANVNDAIEAVQAELGTDPAGAQATVKARLESSEVAIAGTSWPETGRYYHGGFLITSGLAATNYALPADTIAYFPFWCPSTVTLAALACVVATSASGNVRLGIYTSTTGSTGMVPNTLLVDAGTASVSTTGIKEVSTSQQLTGGTWYWLAMVQDVAAVYNAMATTFSAATSTLSSVSHFKTQSYTYGALPSSATSPVATNQSAGRSWVCVWVKL